MRDSGQKNAPHLKKGGVPAGSPAACDALRAVSADPLRGCRWRRLAVLPPMAWAL